MTRGKDIYFMSNPDWYYYESEDDDEDNIPLLTEKAPPEAVESYKLWESRYALQKETGILV